MKLDRPPKGNKAAAQKIEEPPLTEQEELIEIMHALSTDAVSEEEKAEVFTALDLEKLSEALGTPGNDDLMEILVSYIADEHNVHTGTAMYPYIYEAACLGLQKRLLNTPVLTITDAPVLSLFQALQLQFLFSVDAEDSLSRRFAPELKTIEVSDELLQDIMQREKPLSLLSVFLRAKNTAVAENIRKTFSSWLREESHSQAIERFFASPDFTYPTNPIALQCMNEYMQEKFGLAFQTDLMPFWKNERRETGIYHNLRTMRVIEAVVPGSVALLHNRFGIKEFGRYPQQILIQQAQDVDKDIPYGVVFFPRGDYNDAFDEDTGNLVELFEDTQGRHGIRIFECDTKRDMARAFLSLNKAYGAKNKIAFGVWGGHGSAHSVELGTESVQTDDFNGEGVQRIREFFEPGAPIVMLACSTGSDTFTEPIAKALADIFGTEVIAPNKDTSVSELGAKYTAKGKIRLTVVYGESSKRKFKGAYDFDSA